MNILFFVQFMYMELVFVVGIFLGYIFGVWTMYERNKDGNHISKG